MKPKEIPLEANKFYHVYNRGNNRANLFYSTENYRYFLRKYNQYLSAFIDTYAYCLLPNHFHLLISVKEFPLAVEAPPIAKVPPFKRVEPLNTTEPLKTEALISLQFRKFFTSYSMSINKQENRVGSLFQKNFKRIEVNSTDYLKNLVFYIHANPQLHRLIDDFKMYPWSSYNGMLIDKPTKLKRENVLDWFDNKDNYSAYHTQKATIELIKNLTLEDED